MYGPGLPGRILEDIRAMTYEVEIIYLDQDGASAAREIVPFPSHDQAKKHYTDSVSFTNLAALVVLRAFNGSQWFTLKTAHNKAGKTLTDGLRWKSPAK